MNMLHTIIGAVIVLSTVSNERADGGIALARGAVASGCKVTGGVVLGLTGGCRVMGGVVLGLAGTRVSVVLGLAGSCRVTGRVVLGLASSCRVTGSVVLRLACSAFFAPGLFEVGGCERASELYTMKNNALG